MNGKINLKAQNNIYIQSSHEIRWQVNFLRQCHFCSHETGQKQSFTYSTIRLPSCTVYLALLSLQKNGKLPLHNKSQKMFLKL